MSDSGNSQISADSSGHSGTVVELNPIVEQQDQTNVSEVIPVIQPKCEEDTTTTQTNQIHLQLDPFVHLVDIGALGSGESQHLSLQNKSSSSAMAMKTSKSSKSSEGDNFPPDPLATTDPSNVLPVGMEHVKSPTPSIVKPRRPSVHFAETEPRNRSTSAGGGFSVKQERKHRSRKEKLVCRSENLGEMEMDTDESSNVSLPSSPLPLPPIIGGTGTISSVTVLAPPPIVLPSLSLVSENSVPSQSAIENSGIVKMKPPAASSRRVTSGTGRIRIRSTTTKTVKRAGNSSRKSTGVPVPQRPQFIPNTSTSTLQGPFIMGGLKDMVPFKKKKVIEIVSPRKRKMDHLELVKTSSDPIIVRGSGSSKTSKSKNKPHNPFKFSRANLNKSSSNHQNRIRRPSTSTTSIQQGSPNKGTISKRFGSPQKKDTEAETPAFPPSCMDDLIWLLKEAEQEFSPDKLSRAGASTGFTPPQSSKNSVAPSIPGSSNVARRLHFGRRRVESEPPNVAGVGGGGLTGFEMTPDSPSGSQFQYQGGKEAYFSPSPSYTTGPAGRRRYSRRRHAKVHPPFDEQHCFFQGHHCPNPKVPGSQYCEKHLDQGPQSGYSQCRYTNGGRKCHNLIPSFDPTGTCFLQSQRLCELHAQHIARSEYEKRKPKTPPDQVKNIIAKITKIYNEGFLSGEMDCFGNSCSPSDVLQIIEEPDIIQEMPLNSFSGGLIEELDSEGERNVNPDKPDYDALKNAGYYTTEEIIQIHIHKLRKLKTLYQREKELEWLTRQQKLRFHRDGLEKLKQFGVRFTTNPYLINKNIEMPKEYIEHQIKQYDAAKAILQTAYKADGKRGLLRLKMLQRTQELARMAKATGQKQHDSLDMYDSDTDVESDSGEAREKRGSSRFSNFKGIKCAYNEGYAVRACQNPPVHLSNYCFKHILSDTKQVQWVPCNRSIGPDPQDCCKTPCFKILEKHGCMLHSPLLMSKHKALKKSEEEIEIQEDSDNEEEEITLEGESQVLANLVADECVRPSHLEEAINRLTMRGPLEQTDTSDSEETDDEGQSPSHTIANDEMEAFQENHLV